MPARWPTRRHRAMATFDEYMATPDPFKKAELVRGEIVFRRPGPVAHALAISTFMDVWLDYSGERQSIRAEFAGTERPATRPEAVGQILLNLGIRYALDDDPDQVRCLSMAIYTPDQCARLAPYYAEHRDA